MFLNQLSIAKRLACVLGLILSLSLLTSLFAVFKLRQMGEVTDAMLTAFAEIRSASGLSGDLTVVETAMAQA